MRRLRLTIPRNTASQVKKAMIDGLAVACRSTPPFDACMTAARNLENQTGGVAVPRYRDYCECRSGRWSGLAARSEPGAFANAQRRPVRDQQRPETRGALREAGGSHPGARPAGGERG